MNTLKSGLIPYVSHERTPGRATSKAYDQPVLAQRKVGQTVLSVTAGTGTTGETAYIVRALGNKARETRFLASLATLEQARQYLEAYSPKYRLIGG